MREPTLESQVLERRREIDVVADNDDNIEQAGGWLTQCYQQRVRGHGTCLACVARRRSRCQLTTVALLLSACLFMLSAWRVRAVPAIPRGYHETQPDGSSTPLLFLRGDERFPYYTDEAGYTVIRDDDGWFVYAKRHDESGHWTNAGLLFHEESDPSTLQVPKHLLPADHIVQKRVSRGFPRTEEEHHARRLQHATVRSHAGSGTATEPAELKTLAILIRFSDHKNRRVPSRQEVEVVFNKKDGDPVLCPTGSVFDVWNANSNNKFHMLTNVVDWIDLPESEAYYSGGQSGWEIDRTREAFYYALDRVDADPRIKLEDYDVNKDGVLDAIAFIHSGIAAEHGDRDCETGNDMPSRIWSHRSWGTWINTMGSSRLRAYYVSSAIWPRNFRECQLDIGRIGLIAHESGHHIGLPDLYDGEVGFGDGNWDFMANMWGWDLSQYNPPNLSPWSKLEMGWSKEVTLSTSGVYTIRASAHIGEVYVIRYGFPNEDEFLIVENRQPVGFDVDAPGKGGLAIWHIDRRASHTAEGYPSQPGFPENGRHYQNSLLQADGNYDLELGENRGNAADLFAPNLEGSATRIGPDGVDVLTDGHLVHKDFPNTGTYQSGQVRSTGITISDISEPGEWVSFRLSGLPGGAPPPPPTPAPVAVVQPDTQDCHTGQYWDGQKCQHRCNVLEGLWYDAQQDACQFLCEVDQGEVWSTSKSRCVSMCKAKHGVYYDAASGECKPNCKHFLRYDASRQRCVCPGEHSKLKRRKGEPAYCRCVKGYERSAGQGECKPEVSGNQQRRRRQEQKRHGPPSLRHRRYVEGKRRKATLNTESVARKQQRQERFQILGSKRNSSTS